MKKTPVRFALAILSLAVGLASVAAIAFGILNMERSASSLGQLWKAVSRSVTWALGGMFNLRPVGFALRYSDRIVQAYLAAQLAAAILAAILAGDRGKSKFWNFILCFIFPPAIIFAAIGSAKRLASLSKSLSSGYNDLVDLWESGLVNARATGQSITEVRGEIENLRSKRLGVTIKPGTYFKASGNFQNMVTRSEYSFSLDPREKRVVSIAASCINADLPIPQEKDHFKGVAKVPSHVAKFIEAARGMDKMVVQAGIWALTDGYSRGQLKTHLVSRYSDGTTASAITDAHIDQAKAILDRLSIRHGIV